MNAKSLLMEWSVVPIFLSIKSVIQLELRIDCWKESVWKSRLGSVSDISRFNLSTHREEERRLHKMFTHDSTLHKRWSWAWGQRTSCSKTIYARMMLMSLFLAMFEFGTRIRLTCWNISPLVWDSRVDFTDFLSRMKIPEVSLCCFFFYYSWFLILIFELICFRNNMSWTGPLRWNRCSEPGFQTRNKQERGW